MFCPQHTIFTELPKTVVLNFERSYFSTTPSGMTTYLNRLFETIQIMVTPQDLVERCKTYQRKCIAHFFLNRSSVRLKLKCYQLGKTSILKFISAEHSRFILTRSIKVPRVLINLSSLYTGITFLRNCKLKSVWSGNTLFAYMLPKKKHLSQYKKQHFE